MELRLGDGILNIAEEAIPEIAGGFYNNELMIDAQEGYGNKLILRNIFLNKQKALASSIGVIIRTVLLITAFGAQAALLKVANQIGDVYTYDLKVDYTRGTSSGEMKLPSGIENNYDLSTFPVEFIKADAKEIATLVVTEKENDLIRFFDEKDSQTAGMPFFIAAVTR